MITWWTYSTFWTTKSTSHWHSIFTTFIIQQTRLCEFRNKNPGDPPRLDIKMDNNKMIFIRNSVIKEATSPEELMVSIQSL